MHHNTLVYMCHYFDDMDLSSKLLLNYFQNNTCISLIFLYFIHMLIIYDYMYLSKSYIANHKLIITFDLVVLNMSMLV